MVDPGCIILLLLPSLLCTVLAGGTADPLAVKGSRNRLHRDDLASLPMDNHTQPFPKPKNSKVGCKTLKTKIHISNGYCTSIKPVKSVMCTGSCIPERDLPWYARFVKLMANNKYADYSCEDDVIKRKNVKLVCENGETQIIKIKVVKSCKCVRTMTEQNRSFGTQTKPDSARDLGKSNKKKRKHKDRNRRLKKRRRKEDKRRRKGGKKNKKRGQTRTASEL